MKVIVVFFAGGVEKGGNGYVSVLFFHTVGSMSLLDIRIAVAHILVGRQVVQQRKEFIKLLNSGCRNRCLCGAPSKSGKSLTIAAVPSKPPGGWSFSCALCPFVEI